MDDLISRQAAVDSADRVIERDKSGNNDVVKAMTAWKVYIKGLPTIEPEQKDPCEICAGLESGDTLYSSSDWDGGIGFDYIRDIKYCPVCGRQLTEL